jgi:haloalkane dehalogenase
MSTEPNYFDAVARWPGNDVETRLSPAINPDLPGWLRELYPFPVRTFFLADERMSFVDEGDPAAPPLLLLHDSPGWSFAFRRLIPALSAHYRVIAPDLVGFGLSSKPRPDRFHVADHASAIAELIDTLGLKRLSLLVHGWGGPIAMAYAVRNPDNVQHVVLANTWAMPLLHATNIRFPFG